MRIVASLTTIPGREKGVVRCVQRLLSIHSFDSIRVVIPLFFPRIGEKYKQEAIDELKALGSKVEVIRTKKDWGPGSKFFGHKEGTATFVCDDDRLYTRSLLSRLIRKYQQSRGSCVVTGAAKLLGTCGILIPPGFLNGYKGYLSRLPSKFREIDDNTMEVFLLKKGRKIKYLRRNVWCPQLGTAHALVRNRGRRRSLWRQYAAYVRRNHRRIRKGGSKSRVLQSL